jgi:hypothetical protein
MLFWMVRMLFGLFVWNSNGELRRTAAIPSLPRNSRITTILTVPEQQICVWLHLYYFYSENSSYSAVLVPSKHNECGDECYCYVMDYSRLSMGRVGSGLDQIIIILFFIWSDYIQVNFFIIPYPTRIK